MSEGVRTSHTDIFASATLAGEPASSLRLAMPAKDAINHHAGNILGGLRIWQPWNGSSTATSGGTWRYYGYRHPNADHVIWAVKVQVTGKNSATVQVQSGSGAAISEVINAGSASTWSEWVVLRTTYGGTGYVPMTVTLTDCYLLSLTVFEMPREDLDTGEIIVESYDTTYPRIGLREEEVIGESSTAGPQAIIEQQRDVWSHNRRALVMHATGVDRGWTSTSRGSVLISSSDSSAVNFRTQGRQKRAEVATEARAYVYTTVDSGSTYQIWVVSSNPGGTPSSVTSGTLSVGDDGWQTLTGLSVDCTEETAISLELQRLSGSGTVYYSGTSVLEG